MKDAIIELYDPKSNIQSVDGSHNSMKHILDKFNLANSV